MIDLSGLTIEIFYIGGVLNWLAILGCLLWLAIWGYLLITRENTEKCEGEKK